MRTKELIGIIEASYRVEDSAESWLRGVVEATRSHLDAGLGVAGYFVDAQGDDRFDATGYVGVGAMGSPEGVARFQAWDRSVPTDVKRHIHLFGSGGTGRSIPRLAAQPDLVKRTLATHRYAEMSGVNAIDASHRGCALAAAFPSPRAVRVPFGRRALLDRISAHLAAGARLLREPDGRREAVISPAGKVEHAEGDATTERVREALRMAAVGIDRVRARPQRLSLDEVTSVWRALIAGRWSLVECFERGGRRYYVAQANSPELPPRQGLSAREAQIVGAVELGRSNKAIAYELGLSPSSVATHLRRAQAKLGVSSRMELILARSGPADPTSR